MKRITSSAFALAGLAAFGAAFGVAFNGHRVAHAQSPAPVHYRAEFAPVKVVGVARTIAVNPALVTRMDEKTAGITTLTLASGEELRAVGTMADMSRILRVSVWLEDNDEPGDPTP